MSVDASTHRLSRFGRVLYHRLSVLGWSARRFASESGTTASFLSAVATGSRPPPLARLRPWAELLGLDGAAQEAFVLLGQLAHVPPELARAFDRQVSALLAAAAAGIAVEGIDTLGLLATWRTP